jgi:DnaJ-domain-containing protein 1
MRGLAATMMKSDGDYARMNRQTVQVTITLSTGVQMRGNVFHSKNRTLQEELNKGESFLEFEPMDGQTMFLARSAIAAVKELNVPRSDQLSKRSAVLDQFEPYEVLGLKRGADAAQIRNAYVTLAKIYHPDRFLRTDLPPEVAEYLSAVATRVNLAYSELRMTVAGAQMTENAA